MAKRPTPAKIPPELAALVGDYTCTTDRYLYRVAYHAGELWQSRCCQPAADPTQDVFSSPYPITPADLRRLLAFGSFESLTISPPSFPMKTRLLSSSLLVLLAATALTSCSQRLTSEVETAEPTRMDRLQPSRRELVLEDTISQMKSREALRCWVAGGGH